MADANPFDEYGAPEDVPASEGLQPGPAPSLWDSFRENFLPMVGGLSSKPRNVIDRFTVDRAESGGVAQPGDNPLAGKPSQEEADAARQRLDKAKREQERYEAFDSPTIAGKAAGLIGGLAGGILDPTSLIGGGTVLARGGVRAAEMIGASGVLARMAGTGVEGAALTAGLDAAGQGLDVASGLKDGYSPGQTAAAAGIGFGFGFGMHGVAEWVGRAIEARKPAPEPKPEPKSEAPVVPAEPKPEATPVIEAPAVEVVANENARAARAIPDIELKKAVEAADAAPHTADPAERVFVPVEPEQAAALKRSGVDIDEQGTMPRAAVDALREEHVRREVEAQAPKAGEASSVATARSEADPTIGETAQPLSAQPMAQPKGGQVPAVINNDARFPARRELGGEVTKPRQLPADASPAEVAAFRVTDAMRGIVERLGRKLEVDGRFTAKKALGEYKPGSGVIRLRQEGDFEVFSHEVGHAVDQRLRNGDAGAEWKRLLTTHADELRALDANVSDPAKQTVSEGIAEFLRTYVTNPAYARQEAPTFAPEFERMLATRDPELGAILADAARVSQIDSGLPPADVMRSMVVSGLKPEGWAKFAKERKEHGLAFTAQLWFDRFYSGLFAKDHWAKRFVDQLKDARFEKTGKPLPEFGWSDPYKSYRMLPGARQAAVDALYYGVRGYGRAFGDPESPALYDALSKAFGGRVSVVENPDDPLVKSFSAYLIARRSAALYDRWARGELKNQPVRASRNEVTASIAEFEKAFPQFKDAADDVFSFANAMWRKKFEAGLIGRDVYDAVAGRGDDYVPFYRDMREGKSGSGRGGSAATSGSERVKSIKGSTRDIIDPLHSLIFDTAQTERIIALNDVVKGLHRLAETGGEFSGRFLERVPNTELKATSVDLAEAIRSKAKAAGVDKIEAETIIRNLEELVGDDLSATVFRAHETTARGERILFYWDAGQRVPLKVGDSEYAKEFFDLFSVMSAPERDIMLGFVARANGLFASLITNAPQFALKNLVMDNLSRIFIARHTGVFGRVPGSSIAAGVYTQIFDREFAKAYARVGGIRGGIASAVSRELDEAKGIGAIALRPKSGADIMAELGNPKDLVVHAITHPIGTALHALEKVVQLVESTETMGRLGQAKIVFRHLKKQGLSDEDAFRGAVYEARDVLDYDRKGWAVAGAARFLPFYNAGLQGTERSGRNLFGAPVQAAIQAYRRGGYAALDGEMKSALSDAVKNWGMIAAGATATLAYSAYMSDQPVYQRMSEYMRRRYFIFPAGVDADGKVNIVTLPKPFDHAGGIFSAIEAAVYGIRRGDPETWSKVMANLKEGFIPRQLSSGQDFLNSLPPTIKVPFEVATGKKLGFDGGPSFPIVPQNLAALPPDMQSTATTSWLGKQMGKWFGLSPVVVDHVVNGFGATAARDSNTLLTALLDNQPNVTPKDAMRQMFFGGLYREQKGAGAFKSDLMELMGRENGEYIRAARGYVTAKELGDQDEAASIYNRGNDLAKTVMTIRSGPFKPDLRQLHPLERTSAIGDILSSAMRDLAASKLSIIDRSRKRGEERQFIQLQPTIARAITNTMGSLAAEEIRNGLKIAGVPGYEEYDVIDTKARYDAIRSLSPEVADELAKRLKKAHVLPAKTVEKAWPELKRRLLADREQARIGDLRH